MIETAVPLTLTLAIGLGAILLAAGIGGFSATAGPVSDWAEAIEEMDRMPGLTLALAFVAILFGGGILLVHHHWSDPLAAIVTLIAWASFAEGLLLLGMPRLYLSFARLAVRYTRPWAAVATVLGLALLIAGLTGRATSTL